MPETTPPPAASPPAQGSQVAGAGQQRIGEITVEVADENCRNLLWGPTQDRLRGRWDWSKLPRGETSERGLTKMPIIPGLYITVQPRERRAVILDPLTLPENARTLAEVSAAHAFLWNQSIVPVETRTYENLSPNQLATWLYWMWRGLESKTLRQVSGRLFTLADLAAAYPQAKIRRQFYDSLGYRLARPQDVVTAKQAVAELSQDGD